MQVYNYAIKLRIKNLKMSRDQSFTATKSKDTRNKILAQENSNSLTPTFGLIFPYFL